MFRTCSTPDFCNHHIRKTACGAGLKTAACTGLFRPYVSPQLCAALVLPGSPCRNHPVVIIRCRTRLRNARTSKTVLHHLSAFRIAMSRPFNRSLKLIGLSRPLTFAARLANCGPGRRSSSCMAAVRGLSRDASALVRLPCVDVRMRSPSQRKSLIFNG